MFKSKKEEYILAIGKNNFYVNYPDGEEETIFVKNIKLNPNVPFFHYLFDTYALIKEININKKLFNKNIFYTLIQDDTSKADMKILSEYFKNIGVQEIAWVPQNIMMSSDEMEQYISISKTIRCFIVSYINVENDIRGCKKKVFLDKDVTIDTVEEVVNDIRIEFGKDINVYINNIDNDMDEFKNIGTLISKNEILDNTRKFFSYGK